MSSLTIMLPTVGRPTLPRQLHALAEQEWREGDELLLISDDNHDWCQQMFRRSGLPGRHIATMDGPLGDWGHTQRNWFMRCARGTHLWHIDDDDVALPGAMARIHAAIDGQPEDFHLFRFDAGDGNVYWDQPGTGAWSVGTPCLVHPRDIPLGVWESYYGGDGRFVRTTISLNRSRHVHWHDEIIYARILPDGAPLRLDECFAALTPRLRSWRPQSPFVPGKRDWVDLRQHRGSDGRGDFQAGWHALAATLFRCQELLDVGSGLAESRVRFTGTARRIVTQDPGPGLPVDLATPVEQIPAKSFDVVTCFDVLEHVEADADFIVSLLRIARRMVFVTTPNWLVSRAGNAAHVREYTPSQLAGFLVPLGARFFWVGDGAGYTAREVSILEFIASRDAHLGVLLGVPD